MQFTITINQIKALEWGLNAQQALLFAFVYECPSWAAPVERDGSTFYALSKAKILEELPLLTDKPDTAYRMLKALAEAGVIELGSTSSITLVRLTEKGTEWNRKRDGSEKYPTSKAGAKLGKKSEHGSEKTPSSGRKKIRSTSEKNPSMAGKKSDEGRKNFREGSEKNPTNQDTSNQVTSNQDTSNQVFLPVAPAAQPADGELIVAGAMQEAPRVEIPSDMPGPKDQSCKTFRSWANYAFAYRKRYGAWPVWNAQAGGVLGKLIDRIGAEEAPKVAAFFVGINDALLIARCHPLSQLLANAEGYRTQWLTGRQINTTTARQVERKQANLDAGLQAAENILARATTQGVERNEFL